MFAMFAMVSAVSAVSAMAAVFRHSRANREGDGENDRKEGFHGTKVFVAARSRYGRRDCSPIQVPKTQSTFHQRAR
jgi:hypothetical protein